VGGFASGIADAASKLVDAIEPAIKEFAEHKETLKANIGAASHVLDRTDEGKIGAQLLNHKFFPVSDATTEAGIKGAIENFNNSDHPDYKKPIDVAKHISDGQKAGRLAALGPNDGRAINLAKSIRTKHGPAEADNFSNVMAFVLKDYANPSASSNPLLKGKSRAAFSPLKVKLQKAGVNVSNTNPSYLPAGNLERAYMAAQYQTLSPLMVVSHLGSVFNSMLGTTPKIFISSVAKTLIPALREELPESEKLLITGVFHADVIQQAKYLNMFYATGRNEVLGSGVARYLYDLFHMPGMSKLARFRLTMDSQIGRATVEDAAKRYTDLVRKQGPDATRSWKFGRNYKWVLEQAGLNPSAILEQGGKLSAQDLKTSVYSFVNDHDFLHKPLNRSMFTQATPVGRILGSYHAFVTNQAKLMSKAMFRDMNQRGAASVVRNLAVGGIIMPLMGEAINIFQQSYRGQPALDTLNRDEENLSSQHGAKGYLQTWADGMAHFGGFGIYGHFVRASLTHSLALTAAGPAIGSAINLGQDSLTAGLNDVKYAYDSDTYPEPKDNNWNATKRDAMYDTPGLSVLAQVLAHRMLPTAKDNPESDPLQVLYEHMAEGDDSSSSSNKNVDESNQQKEKSNGRSKRNYEFEQSP
jgi:hypothetical protein